MLANALRFCHLHPIKTETFSKISNLDDSHISLPAFPSRTNLKLQNIHVTPNLVTKVITNLDSSKTSGPDFITVVVLKSCEPELSDILAKVFSMSLKESHFRDRIFVSSVIPLRMSLSGLSENVGDKVYGKKLLPC